MGTRVGGHEGEVTRDEPLPYRARRLAVPPRSQTRLSPLKGRTEEPEVRRRVRPRGLRLKGGQQELAPACDVKQRIEGKRRTTAPYPRVLSVELGARRDRDLRLVGGPCPRGFASCWIRRWQVLASERSRQARCTCRPPCPCRPRTVLRRGARSSARDRRSGHSHRDPVGGSKP